jgi:hypothetical protein
MFCDLKFGDDTWHIVHLKLQPVVGSTSIVIGKYGGLFNRKLLKIKNLSKLKYFGKKNFIVKKYKMFFMMLLKNYYNVQYQNII